MAQKTKIEWTQGADGERGSTWNPVSGCTLVSPGCTNCYAMRMAARLTAMGQKKYAGTTKKVKRLAVWTGKINFDEAALTIPLRVRKPTTWFVNSMSDLFHEGVPFEFIDKVFAVMALTPQHTYQILTKRAERMAEYVADCVVDGKLRGSLAKAARDVQGNTIECDVGGANGFHRLACITRGWPWPLPNVHLGVSVEDQKRADERIPELLRCPAAVRFLSVEPLLEVVRLNKSLGGTRWIGGQRGCGATHRGIGTPDCPRETHHHHDDRCNPGVDWIIVGGESGPGARPFDVSWARSIVLQCRENSVPVFVKQLGAHVIDRDTTSAAHFPPEQCWPDGTKTDGHRVLLKNKKGGDMAEWPKDLRVREMPTLEVAHA